MEHEDYIRLAIEIAKAAEKEGEPAIGAVIVKDEKVIASGKSSVWPQKDPSGHSESNCIRAACEMLDTLDLSECVMYGTLEPCGMCLSTAAWANLKKIYFGSYREDVSGNDFEIKNWSAEKAASNMSNSDGIEMMVQGGILRKECASLLNNYQNWQKL